MNRPYIFCHMMTSIDGKIMGKYMDTPASEAASDVFYRLAFGDAPYYQHQGWLSGRITTDDNFTHYRKPELDQNDSIVPEGDYLANTHLTMYYVSIDPSGKLGWQSNELQYRETKAHIIEVITDKATNTYKAFLRKLGISYIIVGTDKLDYALLLQKLKDLFSIKTLMLGGGGVLNWSFIQAGMCDELSMVIAPVADGSSSTPALFETKNGFTTDNAVSFQLEKIEIMEGDSVWLRYKVK